METEGDAYVKTLNDELPFLVQASFDTHASVGVFVALVGALSWELSQIFIRNVMGCPGQPRTALDRPLCVALHSAEGDCVKHFL